MSKDIINPGYIDVVFETLRARVNEMAPHEQLQFSERIMSFSPPQSVSSPSNTSTSTAAEQANSPESSASSPGLARRKFARAKALKARKNPVKKSVNAFMIFRSYISPLLNGIPQKSRSPMLSLMWKSEKRRHLFSILGAAFTKIRDEYSDCPSLEKFLRVAVRIIRVIPAQQYFELAGWAMINDDNGKSLIQVGADHDTVAVTFPLQSNASPHDVVQYCINQGLINAPRVADDVAPFQSMSFAALPRNHDLDLNFDTLNGTESQPQGQANVNDLFAFIDFGGASSENRPSQTFDVISTDQGMAYNANAAVAHWHPEVHPPILGMDLNVIQDDFDPFTFNVDDFVALGDFTGK